MYFPYSFWMQSGSFGSQSYIGGDGGDASLKSNLLAYYAFNANAHTYDSSNHGYTLSPNSIVSWGGGIAGTDGASMAGDGTTGPQLTAGGNSANDFAFNSSFTISFWLKPVSIPSNAAGIVATLPSKSFWYGFQLIRSTINTNFSGEFFVLAADFTNPKAHCLLNQTGWNFITLWYDSAGGTINLQTGLGSINTVSAPSPPKVTSDSFTIGSTNDKNMNYIIDEMGIWKKILSDAEKARLFNNGIGRTWPI